MSKKYSILFSLVAGTALVLTSLRFTHDNQIDEQFASDFHEDYKVYALTMPTNLSFAGEVVPLEDPDVFERMDKELLVNTYWQSNGLLMFKRTAKYFPVIEPILNKNGIPDDFKYLAVIESGLINVVSPAGATGMWQILKGTAEERGLEVNDEVDERYHLEKSTQAACEYLREAHDKLGSWSLAAAAYNMGINGVQKQLERQKTDNYYDLLLNTETGRYVFRILAVKEIIENPKKYGFNYRNKDLYQHIPTKVVAIDSSISHFADFASQYQISYKTLKYHNPWLRDNFLTNKKNKTYLIEIPKEGFQGIYLKSDEGVKPEKEKN